MPTAPKYIFLRASSVSFLDEEVLVKSMGEVPFPVTEEDIDRIIDDARLTTPSWDIIVNDIITKTLVYDPESLEALTCTDRVFIYVKILSGDPEEPEAKISRRDTLTELLFLPKLGITAELLEKIRRLLKQKQLAILVLNTYALSSELFKRIEDPVTPEELVDKIEEISRELSEDAGEVDGKSIIETDISNAYDMLITSLVLDISPKICFSGKHCKFGVIINNHCYVLR